MGTISCLRKRAERLCGDAKLKDKRNQLQEAFEANGYLVQQTHFKYTTQEQRRAESEEEGKQVIFAYLISKA